MHLAEVGSTQEDTVPQLVGIPSGGIAGSEGGDVPSLNVFESTSVTDQSRSSESGIEILAPSATTPSRTTQSLQREMSPDLGSKFVRNFSEDSFAALDVIDGEKEDADFPGATSDESLALSELTDTATPTSTRDMPTIPSAPAMEPSSQSSKITSDVSEANDPTDEKLREAVTELIDAVPTVEDLTIRKILTMMEERFSCALDSRKAIIKLAAREAMDRDESNESLLGGELSQDDPRAANENSAALPVDSSVAHGVEDEAILGDTESSGSESEGSDGEEEMSPPPGKMPHREPRRTSARRALATIRMKQGMHAEKTSNRRRVIRADGGESERSKSDSDSESASDADSPAEKSEPGAKGEKSRNGARRRAKKSSPQKSTVEGGGNDDVADGDATALVDSDEDHTKNLDPAAKAVIQEEMDDVDEEKVKERNRVQAERQRQLEALRTMTTAQLKEATRAAQGSLMAKIKARQDEVHAALAASAKEEMKRLKAEARREAGMEVEGDGDGGEGEEVGGARGVDVPGVAGGAGAETPGALQVEGIVAKEEDAMAAAQRVAVASSRACLSSEESDGDGEHKGDLSGPKGDRNAKGGATDSRGPTGKHARDSKGESSGSSSSSSGSSSEESDEELEILPASSTSDKGRSSVQGFKPNANRTGPPGGGTGSSGRRQAAGRALAALPKAIRFTSPNTADKSRAANRRQLVASARNVANDRWASQLGYRDSREHIRDLKYMELKRRQQAQVERERREKENAALATRLLEYAAHAEDDEKQFGEAEAEGSLKSEAPDSKASDDSANGIPDAPEQSSDAAPSSGEGNDAGPVPRGITQASGESNPLPSSFTPKIVPDAISAGENVEDTENTPDGTGTPEPGDEPDGAQGRVGEENQAGPGLDESSCLREDGGGETGVDGSGDRCKTMVSAAAPESVRPPVLRTYGRKEHQAADEGLPKDGEPVAPGAAAADLSDESQALWREEPDSVPAMPALGAGGDDTQETCDLSLGLDILEDDEATRPIMMEETAETVCPGDSNGTGELVNGEECSDGPAGKDESGDVEANQAAVGGTNGAASGAKRKLDEGATAVPAVRKMTVAADGSLRVAAPAQPSLATFFNKAGDELPAVAPSTDLPASAASKASGAQKKKGIAAFFGNADSSDGKGGDADDDAAKSAENGEVEDQEGTVGDENSSSGSDLARINTVTDSGPGDAATQNMADEGVERVVEDGKTTEVEREQKEETTDKPEENANEEEAPAMEGKGETAEEEESSKEPKDRAAEYRAILEAERTAAKRAKKLRKSGMMDDEAEEEEEEEGVRGLGDFGFGVPASGSGTSATATGGAKDDEEVDEEIREEDLEGIVDTFSDDEGDKDAQEEFLKDQAAAGERQALKDLVRRVREGFGDERGGHGRSSAARGSLRLDQLTAADRSSRKEARRLGLLNSDEEWSDDEKGKADEKNLQELDEQALGELLAREQRARHMGLSQTAQEYLESSDSEGGEDGDEEGKGEVDPLAAQEEMERREEERVQKLWVKRAKRRRVLAEVEHAGNTGAGGAGMDNRGPEMLMEDEDSQAILNVLQRTNSRLSTGNGTNSSAGSEGGVPGAGEATSSAGGASGSGKRRARNEYAGELDAREVANGFGMGMSMSIKRSRSEGNNPKKKSASKSGDVIDRSFSMPQFVTSVAGFGGSARAKQAQKKASFLSRAGSLQARSGSLASGKTTVSASKFVFMSSIVGEDAGTRMGFDDASARDSAAPGAPTKDGAGMRRADGSNSNSTNSRSSLYASTTVMNVKQGFGSIAAGKRSAGKGGGNSSAGGGPAGSEAGRLWQTLCAGSKAKSRR